MSDTQGCGPVPTQVTGIYSLSLHWLAAQAAHLPMASPLGQSTVNLLGAGVLERVWTQTVSAGPGPAWPEFIDQIDTLERLRKEVMPASEHRAAAWGFNGTGGGVLDWRRAWVLPQPRAHGCPLHLHVHTACACPSTAHSALACLVPIGTYICA